jgi:hypothetical protein
VRFERPDDGLLTRIRRGVRGVAGVSSRRRVGSALLALLAVFCGLRGLVS